MAEMTFTEMTDFMLKLDAKMDTILRVIAAKKVEAPEPELLTLSQAADFLNRSPSTIYGMVRDIGMTAKTNCKIQSIGQTIRYGKVDDKYQVTTEGETSVYLEFGTGNFAKTLLGNYPDDWKDMAMQFYINGLGRSPASPFVYPAYQQHAGEAVLTIEDKIEQL